MKLYDDQADFVESIRDAFRSHESVLAQAPTGFGKTVVAAFIAKNAMEKGKRVYFTVHRKNLITQTQRTFLDWDIPHGVIAAGRAPAPHELVQVASIQTLVRRLGKVPRCDLMVVDECHLACSKSWSTVLRYFRGHGARLLGNTATPDRLDGRPLGEHFDTIVEGPSVRSLIDAGRLSDYRIFAPEHGPALESVRTTMGDYATAELEVVMDQGGITGDAVDHYRRIMPGRRALAFCVSIRHSQHVTEVFRASGIAAAHIDGTTPDAERRRVIRDFADGRVMVLSNVELVTTGFDLSSQVGREVPVEGAIMLRPTQSLTLWLQMIGRALRRKPEPAILLDHAGGSHRHGLPDDSREWSLEGRKKGKKKQEVAVTAISHCPECFAIFRAGGVCPVCGHQLEVKGRLPDEQEGELKEVDPEEHRARRQTPEQRRRKAEEYRATAGKDRVDLLESLTRLAIERDYKVGWAARKYTHRKTGEFNHPDLAKVRAKEERIRERIAGERGAA